MTHKMAKSAVLLALLGIGLGLSGCVQEHLSSDFGVAVRQDVAAQIADPDAHYVGSPAPGSNGSRVALAQDRYGRNDVIQPVVGPSSKVGLGLGGAATTPGAPAAPVAAPVAQ